MTTSISKTVGTEPKEYHDSLSRKEAERFFSLVRNAPAGSYDEKSLPGFQKSVDMKYEGGITKNENGE